MKPLSPRIHVLLAPSAPIGVVFRRGPSKRVATVLWDRRSDHFEVGQWLRGRIYERRSDLSPDGRHLIYFAMNGQWKSVSRGSWTAVSRAPYLKALAMFPKGDCWHGGGLWTSKKTYWLNDGHGHGVMHDTPKIVRDASFRPQFNFGGECPGVYYLRLLRDGWRLVEQTVVDDKSRDVFEKPIAHRWVLRKIAHAQTGAPQGKGCYWDEHELVNAAVGSSAKCLNWEWADVDRKRLVWAADGRLYAGDIGASGLQGERVLHDFNGMAFSRMTAPY